MKRIAHLRWWIVVLICAGTIADGRYAEWRRGPYIASACFDLTQPYTPVHAHALMLRHLHGVQWDANPLLKSPEELTEEGLPGEPYMSLPEYEALRPQNFTRAPTL